jgi:cytochrome oxidase Cu insertion factor (SCO1/SenC/PrrC family)
MTSVNMRQIGDAVTASPLKDSVKVLEISVDSGRDTPTRLAAYQQQFGANTWTLASGKEEGLKKLWAFFGNSYSKSEYTAKEMMALPLDWQTGKKSTYDVGHTDLVLIINSEQSWAWLDLGNPNPGKANIPAKLKAYLSEEGLNNLAKPQEPSWTADAVLSALSSITGTKIALANN